MGRDRHDDEPHLLDAESFRRAVVDHGRAVHRFLASRLGPEAADDALSETFVAAWRARAKFVDPDRGGVEAWLIRIASIVVSAHRRQEQRWLRMCADTAREEAIGVGHVDDAERAAERVDAADLLRRARIADVVLEMPRREREPFLLYVLDGRPYAEIAKILDLPIGTVRSRISRGRHRLAALLEPARGGRR